MEENSKLYVMRGPGRERDGLKDLILVVKNKLGNGLKMVEIGSYAGESSEMWAESGAFEKIVCVDAWKNGWNKKAKASNTTELAEKKFDEVAAKHKCIEKMKSTSLEAAKEFDDESLDLVYIDSDSTYESVKSDIEAWLPKVRKGGIISGHDYRKSWEGVIEAVDEKAGKPDRVFKDSSWLVFVENTRKPKILICTCCNSEERKRQMWDVISTHKKYADLFDGIDSAFEIRHTDKKKPPTWERFLMLSDHMDDGYDYLMWIDDDAGFVRFDSDFRNHLPNNEKLFYFTQERIWKVFKKGWRAKKEDVFLNAGVFLVKCCDKAKRLLKDFFECRNDPTLFKLDQTTLIRWYFKNQNECELINSSIFNAFPDTLDRCTPFVNDVNRDSIIVHLVNRFKRDDNIKKKYFGNRKRIRVNLVSLQFQPNIEVYKEWLTYHHALGFDKIFVLDNNRTDFDNETEPLPKLFDNVTVIPVTNLGKYRGGEQRIRFDYAKEYTKDADYIIVLDSDEFLYFKDNISVKQFLKRYEDLPFEQLGVPWIGIGSNKAIKSGSSWITDFHKINKGEIPNNLYNDKREDLLCKTFFKTSALKENDYQDRMHFLAYKLNWRNAYNCNRKPIRTFKMQAYTWKQHPTPFDAPARIYHFRWGYLDDIIKGSIRYKKSNFYGFLTNKYNKDRVVDNIPVDKLAEMYEKRFRDFTIEDDSLLKRMEQLRAKQFDPNEYVEMKQRALKR